MPNSAPSERLLHEKQIKTLNQTMTDVLDALSIVMTKERRTLGIMTMSRSATLPLLHKFRGHITYFPPEFVKYQIFCKKIYIISSIFGFFLHSLGRKEKERIRRALTRITAERGRVKNMVKDPSETIRDLRSFSSSMGPRTKAMTSGAPSYFSFFIR